jgi:hypothetical protein
VRPPSRVVHSGQSSRPGQPAAPDDEAAAGEVDPVAVDVDAQAARAAEGVALLDEDGLAGGNVAVPG